MKYRALLIEPAPEYGAKSQQCMGTDLAALENWATKTLVGAPDESRVVIYETTEVALRTIRKEKVTG